MFELLGSYIGPITVNGQKFDSLVTAKDAFKDYKGGLTIVLNSTSAQPVQQEVLAKQPVQQEITKPTIDMVKITVKKYMTNYGPDFFLSKMNSSPMPYLTMIGFKREETKGLIKMRLIADMTEEKTQVCMKCGRTLTNPVSQYFGVGPECGGHNYVNPFGSDKELKEAVQQYRKELNKVVWEGWIVKSAIVNAVPVPNYAPVK